MAVTAAGLAGFANNPVGIGRTVWLGEAGLGNCLSGGLPVSDAVAEREGLARITCDTLK